MNHGREVNNLRSRLRELERARKALPFVRREISWPCGIWPPRCPTCYGEMFGVIGKYGPFYGCRKFPCCYGSRNLDGSDGRDYMAGISHEDLEPQFHEPDGDYEPSFLNGDY